MAVISSSKKSRGDGGSRSSSRKKKVNANDIVKAVKGDLLPQEKEFKLEKEKKCQYFKK